MQTQPSNLTSVGTVPGPQPAPIAGMTPKPVSFPNSGVHPTEPRKPSNTEVNEAIKTVNTALKSISSTLEFSKDKDTGKDVIRVIDTCNKEVIRQFPSEEMLSIAKAIDQFKGVLIHQKV